MTASVIERLWNKVVVNEWPDACWLWDGGDVNSCGYGRLQVKGKRQFAHRLAYATLFGPIPEGLILRHSCDVPLCCNPYHLKPGTIAENNEEAHERRSHSATKMYSKQIASLRRMLDQGVAIDRVAAGHGIPVAFADWLNRHRRKPALPVAA